MSRFAVPRTGTIGSTPIVPLPRSADSAPAVAASAHASPLPRSGGSPSRKQSERPLIAIGDPRPLTSFALDQEAGLAPLALPESVTGAAVAALLSYDPENPAHQNRLRNTIAPLLVCLAMTTVLQLFIASGVASIVGEKVQAEEATCHLGRSTLTLSCNAVFVVISIVSLKESLEMHRWLHRIPSVLRHTPLKLQKAQQGAHTFYMPADGMGITRAMRCAIYVFAVLPKVVVTVVILSFGSGYLHYAASDAEVLSDCVGMVFISEIDGLLYRFGLSRTHMKLLMSLPPLGLSWEAYKASSRERWVERNTPWLAMGALVLLVPTLELAWCGTVFGAP
jgi:hypothetical protein